MAAPLSVPNAGGLAPLPPASSADALATGGAAAGALARRRAGAAGAGKAKGKRARPEAGAPAEEHAAYVREIRAFFRKTCESLRRSGGKAVDMTAMSKTKQAFDVPRIHGHIPGVAVGDAFSGRAEAAAAGVHNLMMSGIDYATKSEDGSHANGAYAIALAGGYGDDVDHGENIVYTGQGGQSGKMQVRDQELTRGNYALYRNLETKTPIRVLRGKKDAYTGAVNYVYDGLYVVQSYTFEPSRVVGEEALGHANEAGCSPRVYRFVLAPVANEAKVSFLAPEFKCLGRAWSERFRNRAIDKATNTRRGALTEDTAPVHALANAADVVADDISNGLEPYPIRVVNETGDGDAFSYKPRDVDFTYVATCVQGPMIRGGAPITAKARAAIAEAAAEPLNAQHGIGKADMIRRAFAKANVNAVASRRAYSLDGYLKMSSEDGICEEWPTVESEWDDGGPRKDVVHAHDESRYYSRRIHPSLEVYKVSDHKGWGLRCRERILEGSFVCDYVGEVARDDEREEGSPDLLSDRYIMSLDHFFKFGTEENVKMEQARTAAPAPLPAVGEKRAAPPVSPGSMRCIARKFAARKTMQRLEKVKGAKELDAAPRDDELQGTKGEENAEATGSASHLEQYLLCLDAFKVGNLARYINTCDSPEKEGGTKANLILQPIFARLLGEDGAPQPHSMQFYRVALFATRDIEPGEELLYDYGRNYWALLRDAGGDAVAP